MQEALNDLDFPASKEEIVTHAEQYGDWEAVRMLRAMPLATYHNISEIRSSVPLDPTDDEGRTAAVKAKQARSPHSRRVAEHLREVDES